MNFKTICLPLVLLHMFFSILNAEQFFVGSSRQYKVPSAVMNKVKAGDTVNIDSETYSGDVGTWSKDDLYIRGINGTARLEATGNHAQGKAIWVISGNNVRVENIDFSGCRVPDFNGAGIRAEGLKLYLYHCNFHDNEMGILTNNDPNSEMYFESCEFYNNGYGDGYSHNIYVGRCKSFTMKYCYSHKAKIGHCVKSRARYNYIYNNRIIDDMDGTSSMLIDIPNGGIAFIVGNELMEGPLSENKNVITFGMEGYVYPEKNLYVVNNTIISKRIDANFVVVSNGIEFCTIINNIFGGKGTVLTGSEKYDSLYNINSLGLTDPDNYDFNLISSSVAVDKGLDLNSVGFGVHNPEYEYLHPLDKKIRNNSTTLDIGAHEYQSPDNIFEDINHLESLNELFDCIENTNLIISIYSIDGKLILTMNNPVYEVLVQSIRYLENGKYLLFYYGERVCGKIKLIKY